MNTTTTGIQQTKPGNLTFGGLGGTPMASGNNATTSFLSSSSKSDNKGLREGPLPNELLVLVEELKGHIKSHKVMMTEVGRATDKDIEKVSQEIEETRVGLRNLSNQIHRQVIVSNALLNDFKEELQNGDMAVVTRDTPKVLQNEITRPTLYFQKIVTGYQNRMAMYKREIERAESVLNSLMDPSGITSNDLWAALKGCKDTVTTLAANVQDLHESVETEVNTNRNLQQFVGGPQKTSKNGDANNPNAVDDKSSNVADQMNQAYDKLYDKVNILFNPKTPDPRARFMQPGPMSMPMPGSLYSYPTTKPYQNFSTPIRPQYGSHGGLNASTVGSNPLFQTQQSTILGSSFNVMATPPTLSLKRTKP